MRGGANIKAKLALKQKINEKERADKQVDKARVNVTSNMTEAELMSESQTVQHFWKGTGDPRTPLVSVTTRAACVLPLHPPLILNLHLPPHLFPPRAPF